MNRSRALSSSASWRCIESSARASWPSSSLESHREARAEVALRDPPRRLLQAPHAQADRARQQIARQQRQRQRERARDQHPFADRRHAALDVAERPREDRHAHRPAPWSNSGLAASPTGPFALDSVAVSSLRSRTTRAAIGKLRLPHALARRLRRGVVDVERLACADRAADPEQRHPVVGDLRRVVHRARQFAAVLVAHQRALQAAASTPVPAICSVRSFCARRPVPSVGVTYT